ncbi:MAG: right-handed parallel beta-helix repeat-containing protein [Bacteroidia bacterium]|jgi:parallel beta-helix repeat protein
MKKLHILLLCIGVSFFMNSRAATNVSGSISANATWLLANSPYIVTSSISISPGITLTIENGVVVQFNDGYGMSVLGTLNATGTVFTSSSAMPSAGKWTTLNIGDPMSAGSVTMISCQVSYGQYISVNKGTFVTNGTSISNFQYYGVLINGLSYNVASANLTGGTINNIGQACIRINQGGSFSTNGTNLSNSNYGVFTQWSPFSPSSLTGGTISGMTQAAIYTNYDSLVTLTSVTINSCLRGLFLNNSRISLSGCTITGCTTPIEYENPSDLTILGTANSFTGNTNSVVHINHSSLYKTMILPTIDLPYYFQHYYTIYNGGKLVLSDENILKFYSNGINVHEGKLIANASSGKLIYFTSYRDDNIGGDANNDGNATGPEMRNWSGITFSSGSIDSACILRRVAIRFADHGVSINRASPLIDECTFNNNYFGVYATDDSYPVINGCNFGSSGMTPIALTFDADPVFTGNIFSFQDNVYDGIGVIGSSIVTDATLKIRSVTNIPNITYVLLGDITIPAGKTLTINKGIVIKSPPDSYYKINVQGALFANGTADSNIIMTSARDDNAGMPGDLNKDGTQSSPVKGDFGGVVFAPGSLSSSVMDYCDVRYAVLYWINYANQWQNNGSITMINASPTISNCKISNCNIGIMSYQVSNPVLSNNQIINSSLTPVAISVSANPTFTGITFTNAGLTAIGIIGEDVMANGSIKKRNISGFTNISYVLLDNLIIASGSNVDIEAGIVLKCMENRRIEINGGLKIFGNASNRITFTSIKDDNVGNPFDTNGDGNATTPESGDWDYISYNMTSDDSYSVIRSADFKFGGRGSGYAVNWNSAAASMDDCVIANTRGMGLRFSGNSNPIIDSIHLLNGTKDPIGMSLTSDPTFTNITFTANATKGIQIIDDKLSSNALLRKRSLAGISNIAYFINHLVIDADATLTIEAGVVIKSNNHYPNYEYSRSITINGAIVALGTASDKIIFTSQMDDSYGGDYNNDGNITSPSKNDWNGLCFYGSNLSSTLKNCVFRYGGGRYYYYYPNEGVINLNSTNNVTIDSCIIEQSDHTALAILGSTSSIIKNTQIININKVPVEMSMFSSPEFINITLSNVLNVGLGIIPETYSQTATVPIRNFAGYSNITYIGLGTIVVNSGTTITVPAGIVFKGGDWRVNGKLLLNGTRTSPIVFTCIADDAYGSPMDTRLDGNLQDPKDNINDKIALQFEDISDDASIIRNTIFRYQRTDLQLNSASPLIDSCTFQRSVYGLFLTGVSQPLLTNCRFDNMFEYHSYWGEYKNGYPMYTSILSYPSSTVNNTISGEHTFRGIGILNETLSQDVTLTKRNFAGIPNIPYLFDGFTIGSGATLTIAPGVVCKFTRNALTVNKGLIAEGGFTADSIIVFTVITDDFYGGDTNADSNDTKPSIYNQNWEGIIINNQAINTLCRFKNVVVNHANYGLNVTSKSPSVSNSLFSWNQEGLHLTGASNPVVSNCDFMNNYNYGINNVDKSFTINAENCWWNENNGPTHSSNPGGTGDKVSDEVDYNPFRIIDAQNPVMGDVSLNGKVQAYDAALILQKAVSIITFNEIQTRVGDVSGSAGITAFDASLVLQFVVDRIHSFPAEELFKTGLTPAFASLKIENKSVKAGELFIVPVHVYDVDQAMSLDLHLQYDNRLLELIEWKSGAYTAGLNLLASSDVAGGNLMFALASANYLENKGDLVFVTFRVKSDVTQSAVTAISINRFLANENNRIQEVSGGLVSIEATTTGIGGSISNSAILKPYPNPFVHVLNIPLMTTSENNPVAVEIYALNGKLIQRWQYSALTIPTAVVWDARNMDGITVPNGTYLIRILTGNSSIVHRVSFCQ